MSTSWNETLPEQQGRGISVPHLVMGLVFLGLAGSWLLHEVGVIESVEVQWLLPLILVVAGAAGLLASVARGAGRGPQPSSSPTDTRSEGLSENPSESPTDNRTDETFVTDDDTP